MAGSGIRKEARWYCPGQNQLKSTRESLSAFRLRFNLGDKKQTARLVSGLVLFSFVLTHFLNHGLGIFSQDLMEDFQVARSGFWRSPVATIVLYGALTTHICFGIWRLINRNTWRMPVWEALQILLAIAIPFWLGKHILATRFMHETLGHDDAYMYEISSLWPGFIVTQNILWLCVWAHSVVGLHYWLRIFSWYKRAFPWLLSLAVAIPVCAIWGWMRIGEILEAYDELDSGIDERGGAWLSQAIENYKVVIISVAVCIVVLISIRAARSFLGLTVNVQYPGGRSARGRTGQTLLEISRHHNIPHASVCGGRARCSTCRVAIENGQDLLEPPDENESRVLRRIKAPENVRLACQLRPHSDIEIRPLVPVKSSDSKTAANHDAYHLGVEQQIVVLFCDIRGFTSLSENHLSYDVVYLLNRYHQVMTEAIEAAGGYIDKYIGDGIMAIFGVSNGPQKGCFQSIEAVLKMRQALDVLNSEQHRAAEGDLRIGVGVHTGHAILGRIGASGHSAAGLTALGDMVNTASRLESATKDHQSFAIISKDVFKTAQVDLQGVDWVDIAVRGRQQPIQAMSVKNISDLAGLLR